MPATYTANYSTFKSLPYAAANFEPVSHLVDIPMFLFAGAQTPASSVQELAAHLKTKSSNFASTGLGSTGHFLGALFSQTVQIDVEHVPYNGSANILPDLLSGEIDFLFDPANVPMPHAKDGKLKVLAVSLPQRCLCQPDVPTMEEAGYPGFVQSSWTGIMAPAGVSPEIATRFSQAIAAAVAQPEIAHRLQGIGMQGVGSTPAQFSALIERDTATYGAIAKQANILIQ